MQFLGPDQGPSQWRGAGGTTQEPAFQPILQINCDT